MMRNEHMDDKFLRFLDDLAFELYHLGGSYDKFRDTLINDEKVRTIFYNVFNHFIEIDASKS